MCRCRHVGLTVRRVVGAPGLRSPRSGSRSTPDVTRHTDLSLGLESCGFRNDDPPLGRTGNGVSLRQIECSDRRFVRRNTFTKLVSEQWQTRTFCTSLYCGYLLVEGWSVDSSIVRTKLRPVYEPHLSDSQLIRRVILSLPTGSGGVPPLGARKSNKE